MDELDLEQPVIWTARGNMAESDLTEKVVWTDNAQETICAVEHWFDGECVKRAVHVMKREGASVLGSIGEL
jgi:hypothetical protein